MGSAGEPADKAGLATAAADHLGSLEGALDLTHVGAQLAHRVDAEATTFCVRGMSEYLDALLRGLEHYVAGGTYDQEQIEARARQLGHLLARPSVLAERAFDRAWRAALFGEGHPYALGGEPTQQSLGELGRDALQAWKAKAYVARNATLIVVGDFDVASGEALVRQRFRDWAEGAPVGTPPPPARGAARALGVVAEHQEMVPVTLGFPLGKTIDGDYATRLVLAQMVDQRVRAVREKLGASYGVYATLLSYEGAGAYMVRGSVDPERAGEALKVLRDAVASLRRGDGFIEDFVRARRRVLEQRIAGTASSLELVLRAAWLDRHGQAPGYDDALVRAVATLTPAQALRLAAVELQPEREVVVALGKRGVLDRAFAEAGLAGATITAGR
jgi:zinc protease